MTRDCFVSAGVEQITSFHTAWGRGGGGGHRPILYCISDRKIALVGDIAHATEINIGIALTNSPRDISSHVQYSTVCNVTEIDSFEVCNVHSIPLTLNFLIAHSILVLTSWCHLHCRCYLPDVTLTPEFGFLVWHLPCWY